MATAPQIKFFRSLVADVVATDDIYVQLGLNPVHGADALDNAFVLAKVGLASRVIDALITLRDQGRTNAYLEARVAKIDAAAAKATERRAAKLANNPVEFEKEIAATEGISPEMDRAAEIVRERVEAGDSPFNRPVMSLAAQLKQIARADAILDAVENRVSEAAAAKAAEETAAKTATEADEAIEMNTQRELPANDVAPLEIDAPLPGTLEHAAEFTASKCGAILDGAIPNREVHLEEFCFCAVCTAPETSLQMKLGHAVEAVALAELQEQGWELKKTQVALAGPSWARGFATLDALAEYDGEEFAVEVKFGQQAIHIAKSNSFQELPVKIRGQLAYQAWALGDQNIALVAVTPFGGMTIKYFDAPSIRAVTGKAVELAYAIWDGREKPLAQIRQPGGRRPAQIEISGAAATLLGAGKTMERLKKSFPANSELWNGGKMIAKVSHSGRLTIK